MTEVLPDDDRLEALRAQIELTQATAERFTKRLTTGLVDALIHAKDLDDAFRTIALSLSRQALNSALAPVSNALASGVGSLANGLVGGLFGGGGGSTVNVAIQTPDVSGFARAQSQIGASLASAVLRGTRGL